MTSTVSTARSSNSAAFRNEIHLVGNVDGLPERRVLPSGDEIVALRVAVPRADGERRSNRSPRHDMFNLTCFSAASRRVGLGLEDGDLVEVEGAMRRSVRRSGSGMTSRMDLEVRVLRRRSRRGRAE